MIVIRTTTGGETTMSDERTCMGGESCDHDPFYRSAHEVYCACHLPIDLFRGLAPHLQSQAIERVALESDDFEVSPTTDGADIDIRLKEDDS